MDVEIIIVVLATFVSGGAMGATGMLLCQWVVRKMSPPPRHRLDSMDPRDIEVMKADMADIAVRLHSVDARLDFTEQLLGGALSGARPPESLFPPQLSPAQGGVRLEVEGSSHRGDTSSDRQDTSSDRQDASSDRQDTSSDGEDTSSDKEEASSDGPDASYASH